MSRKLHLITSIFTAALISVLMVSCLKDDFDKLAKSEWNPSLAFPLVNSTLTVEDIFVQEGLPPHISTDFSGLIQLIYDSHNVSRSTNELISLPSLEGLNLLTLSNQTISDFNGVSNIGHQVSDSAFFAWTYSFDTQLGVSALIDSVFLRSGELNLELSSEIAQDVIVRIEIPELLVQNQPFLQVFQLSSNGTLPQPESVVRNLQNAVLIPGSNESIELKVSARITRSNSSSLAANSGLSLTYNLSNGSYKKLHGSFGSLQFPLVSNDTLEPGIFRNVIQASNLVFENPTVDVQVQNSTGFGGDFALNSIRGFRAGATIPNLTVSAYTFPWPLSGQQGNVLESINFHFDNTNSNVVDFTNGFPRSVLTTSSHLLNVSTPSYLNDTARVRVNTQMTLPLDGLTLNLMVVDTFDFDIGGVNKELEELLVRLNVINGFPLEGKMQVYFGRLSANGQSIFVVDSLYPASNLPLMAAAGVNSLGEAISPVQTITDAIITAAKWQKLHAQNCNKLVIRGRLTSTSQGSQIVRILDDNEMVIRLGAMLKAKKTF